MDNKTLWNNVLTEMEISLSRANFGTWFKHTNIYKQEEGIVFISVPNAFVRDWLANKYHKSILTSLRANYPEIRSIEYIITKLGESPTQKEQMVIQNKVETTPDNLGFNDLYINRDSNLNPKYTFDNFVIGPFNEVAYSAAQAVIKNPGNNYNPLYIYGNTGLGKTHLLQAIGNYLKKINNDKKVYYITSEDYTVDYVNLVRSGKGNYFKEKYRKYDLLIIDDIQFFSKKEGTQEELFHLFNSFYENNKQIIFSSDKSPKFINNIDDRLRSRFEGGMIVDVNKPNYESRLAILQTKAKNMGLNTPDDVLEYLATNIQDNVRELEGSLNTILCQVQVKKRMLNVNEVKNLIKNNIKPKKTISIKDIIKIVSDFYNLEEKFLYEKTRRKEIVRPRQIIMYLLREDFNTSYPYIGQKLGGRDHTTVMHAYEKIKKEIKENNNLLQELEQIRNLMYNN